jgi:hypothetical protein
VRFVNEVSKKPLRDLRRQSITRRNLETLLSFAQCSFNREHSAQFRAILPYWRNQMAKNQNRTAEQTAAQDAKPVNTTAGGFKFKKLAAVTLPVVKFAPDVPKYIRIEGAIYTGKKVEEKKDAARICHIVDHETGEEGLMIVGKVLEGTLVEKYPDDSYVGKSFEIINHGIRGDKKYNTYSITEVEIEG